MAMDTHWHFLLSLQTLIMPKLIERSDDRLA
jgi:hypothetical protein